MLYLSERHPFRLSLDHARGLPVEEEQIIHAAVRLLQSELAHCYAGPALRFRDSWPWTDHPAATSCLSISRRALASRAR